MNAEEKVNAEIKTAMLAKDAKRLEALRAIKSVILLLKTSPEGLTDDSVSKALQKEVKKRKEIGLDFEIDKLTNSIENVKSSDSFQTEISMLTINRSENCNKEKRLAI